jgi:hypothetical protein
MIIPSVADPNPGSGAFLSPGSGMGKKSGSGIRFRDEQPRSYLLELRNHFLWVKILEFLDVDLGWKKVRSGIRDKHPGSATLIFSCIFFSCTP